MVLDFVGAEGTIALAVACAGTRSHVTVVGLAMGAFGWSHGGAASSYARRGRAGRMLPG